MSAPVLARLSCAAAALVFACPLPATAPTPRFVAERPLPRVEYWQQRQSQIDAQMRDRKALAAIKLVFLGDSITDFWLMGEDLWVKGQQHGLAIWNESFAGSRPENRAINLGISGDRTEHILYRLQPRRNGGLGQLDAPTLDPDFIVLLVGINNSWAPEEPVVDSIVAGVRAVLTAAHARKPRARIVLQSLLPTNDPAKNAAVVIPVNARLAAIVHDAPFRAFTSYLDLYPAFVDGAGQQIARYFIRDGLHPSEDGYRVWRDRLVPKLDALRAESHAR